MVEQTSAIQPLHQFEIKTLIPMKLFGIDISLTNGSAWFIAFSIALCVLGYSVTRRNTMVPGRLAYCFEYLHDFIANLVKTQLGDQSRVYFPYIFPFFLFILMANICGMIPYGFTVTSHISVTFSLAILVFVSVVVVGVVKHKWKFLQSFCPKGTPPLVAPIVVVIEIISFLSRPISLALRLCANMVAGHVMLKIFASFVMLLSASSYFYIGLIPVLLNTALTGFEIMVSAMQAYVFTILTCIYLNNALDLH